MLASSTNTVHAPTKATAKAGKATPSCAQCAGRTDPSQNEIDLQQEQQ